MKILIEVLIALVTPRPSPDEKPARQSQTEPEKKLLVLSGFLDQKFARNLKKLTRLGQTTTDSVFQVPPVTEEKGVAFFSSDHRPSDVAGELLFFFKKGNCLCDVMMILQPH